MAIPVLKLNLAPPPTLWRRQHALLSWAVLGFGVLALSLVVGLTWRAYRQADEMGREAFLLSRQTQKSMAEQGSIQAQLRSINVTKELPRWKLAERILGERSSPWSRLTAELERSLVQDVRIRTLQRTRGSDQQVAARLKGEARSREAEAAFWESLHRNAFFSQVILERESERPGGGVEFEYTLPVAVAPPPYTPLPKHGSAPSKALQPPVAKPVPAKAALPKPVASQPASNLGGAKPVPALAPARVSASGPTESSREGAPRLRDRRLQPAENREGPLRPGALDRSPREVKR